MKKAILQIPIIICLLQSCFNNKAPDVSGIAIELKTYRYEQKLFDSAAPSLTNYLEELQVAEPAFTNIFLREILNIDPRWPTDSTAAYVNGFVESYRPVYRDAQKIYKDFKKQEEAIEQACRYVKYYFPHHKLPGKIITYIGPADGYGDAISKDAFLVGLHYHLGKDNPLYQTAIVRQIYPDYLTKCFEPGYIVINAMKNVVNDLYPEKDTDQPLVNSMIEKGKRLYLLQHFLPAIEEYLLIGYTEKQLKDCYQQEAVVWDFFIKNHLLQISEYNTIKNYLQEGPATQELGEAAPGNMGSFAGWQIVKKFMKSKPSTTLQQLIAMDPEVIFREAKYKP